MEETTSSLNYTRETTPPVESFDTVESILLDGGWEAAAVGGGLT